MKMKEIWQEKKSKKSEVEQNICVFFDQDENVSILAESVEKK